MGPETGGRRPRKSRGGSRTASLGVPHSSIPTGLCPKAPGCDAVATRGAHQIIPPHSPLGLAPLKRQTKRRMRFFLYVFSTQGGGLAACPWAYGLPLLQSSGIGCSAELAVVPQGREGNEVSGTPRWGAISSGPDRRSPLCSDLRLLFGNHSGCAISRS